MKKKLARAIPRGRDHRPARRTAPGRTRSPACSVRRTRWSPCRGAAARGRRGRPTGATGSAGCGRGTWWAGRGPARRSPAGWDAAGPAAAAAGRPPAARRGPRLAAWAPATRGGAAGWEGQAGRQEGARVRGLVGREKVLNLAVVIF